MTTAGAIREGFACRLCWRITFAVFVLILMVESLLLVPSAIRFERVELDRMVERAEAWIEPMLGFRRGGEVQGYLLGKPVAPDEFEKTYVDARAGKSGSVRKD